MSKEKIDPPKCYGDASKLAACGNTAQLAVLIEKNAGCVSATDAVGAVPVAWAARAGQPGTVQLLLKHESGTNAPSWRHLRPLHHAVNGFYEDVVRELLGREETDVDAKDEGGTTALHLAAGRGVVSICQVSRACRGATGAPQANGTRNLCQAYVQALVDHKANVNAANASGSTPLHFAANCGQVSVVTYLISKVRRGSMQRVMLLAAQPLRRRLLQGAHADAKDSAGNTPLHVAARTGFPAVVKALLAGGAKATLTNAAGKAPAEVALDADTVHSLGT